MNTPLAVQQTAVAPDHSDNPWTGVPMDLDASRTSIGLDWLLAAHRFNAMNGRDSVNALWTGFAWDDNDGATDRIHHKISGSLLDAIEDLQ
jgi:hypothetical protein